MSLLVGSAYESYVRRLISDGGFDVAPRSLIIKSQGQAITDIDAIGYKDGVLVVCQAKHVIEPDSHHARWKAQHEIARGVRQCLQARAFLRDNPDRMFTLFPAARAHVPIEVFCIVVTPAMTLSGDLFWPVAIVDDAYLQHVIHLGVARTFNAETREIVAMERLYEGATPTGQEFRQLMMAPNYFRYYRGEDTTLISRITSVRGVRFVSYVASDSVS